MLTKLPTEAIENIENIIRGENVCHQQARKTFKQTFAQHDIIFKHIHLCLGGAERQFTCAEVGIETLPLQHDEQGTPS